MALIIDVLVAEREKQGLTMKELAKRIHCRTDLVTQMEAQGDNIKVKNIRKYAKALGLDIIIYAVKEDNFYDK